MPLYWKPATFEEWSLTMPEYGEKIHGKLFVAWSRCEYCNWSGPLERFQLFRLGKSIRYANICDQCLGDENLAAFLLESGWEAQH